MSEQLDAAAEALLAQLAHETRKPRPDVSTVLLTLGALVAIANERLERLIARCSAQVAA